MYSTINTNPQNPASHLSLPSRQRQQHFRELLVVLNLKLLAFTAAVVLGVGQDRIGIVLFITSRSGRRARSSVYTCCRRACPPSSPGAPAVRARGGSERGGRGGSGEEVIRGAFLRTILDGGVKSVQQYMRARIVQQLLTLQFRHIPPRAASCVAGAFDSFSL